jgi:hypothetical protein
MVARATLAAIGLLGLLAVAPPVGAQAQTAVPPADRSPEATPRAAPSAPSQPGGEDGRYSFNRVPDGYLRLDTRTGQVALCSRRQVGWACQLVPDDRIVLDNEIMRLQTENGALKKLLLEHDIALPRGITAPKPDNSADARQPERSSIDRVMSAVSASWRRLVDWIASMRNAMSND